jgi:hypothetical protein
MSSSGYEACYNDWWLVKSVEISDSGLDIYPKYK